MVVLFSRPVNQWHEPHMLSGGTKISIGQKGLAFWGTLWQCELAALLGGQVNQNDRDSPLANSQILFGLLLANQEKP